MQGWGRFGALLAATGTAAVFAGPAQAEAQAWRFHADPVLGTSFDLAAICRDRAGALIAADAARAEIARLDAILSGWRADSELALLNRSESLSVSPELFAVLSACEHWRRETGGAFDARQGEVFALRRAGGADPAELRRLWAAAAAAEVRLDAATRTVTRPLPVRFSIDALAKGYVVDAALAAARAAAPGVAGLMIDIGGDLRCWGEGPKGAGWIAGVAAADEAAPAVLVRTAGRALATSGVRDEGYNHIVGGDAVLAASVLAPTTAEADALATALCAMTPAAGLALAETRPGIEARVVDARGRVRPTSGWETLTVAAADVPPVPPASASASAPVATAAWPARFAVTVDYQLPRQGARAYSPYVAIWITDESSRLVRAITMLGNKLDYVSENYIWWRRYGRSKPQIVAAVSRPTKPAGRYSVVWDGKDDLGHPVGQGKYIVHVEATREDGLHSYQSMEMMLGADPVEAAAPAGEELGPSAARYGRR